MSIVFDVCSSSPLQLYSNGNNYVIPQEGFGEWVLTAFREETSLSHIIIKKKGSRVRIPEITELGGSPDLIIVSENMPLIISTDAIEPVEYDHLCGKLATDRGAYITMNGRAVLNMEESMCDLTVYTKRDLIIVTFT